MRILICNRGEIACRIIKSVQSMGMEAVAIYSEEDRESLHVKMADYSACIGPGDSNQSYLNMANILIVATSFRVDAIHPGYGFLSENDLFVKAIEELGIKFIGPNSNLITLMGNKINALKTVKKATNELEGQLFYEFNNLEELLKVKNNLDYPLMLKYANGGGGRGIAKVEEESQLIEAFNKVNYDASQFETNPSFYVENYIKGAKHIEVQILGDNKGNVVHFGTRDCSIQRRGQKVIEEAPAIISPQIKEKLVKASIEIASYLKYNSLGTFEYLVKGEKIYFLEMNTRLQVEHTVTEAVTNQDLVQLQIKQCLYDELPIKQEEIKIEGHALEIRVNAEDPTNNFAPSPGMITNLQLNSNPKIRYDFGYEAGMSISPYYDSLVGKIIIKDKNREQNLATMSSLVKDNIIIEGVKNNIDYTLKIIDNPTFQKNEHTINFIEERDEKTK